MWHAFWGGFNPQQVFSRRVARNQTDKFNSDPRGGGFAGGVVGSACIAGAPAPLARACWTGDRRLGVSAWLGRGPDGMFVAENAARDELEIIARNLSRIGKYPVNMMRGDRIN